MKVTQGSSQSVWTQISQDALFERIRHVLDPKLEAAEGDG
jgi:hypothetical protein